MRSIALLWMSLLLLTSCTVTGPIDLPTEPNFPPSVASPPTARDEGRALDQIIRVDLSDPNLETELTFPVIIRDGNVDQALDYRVFIDFVVAGLTSTTEASEGDFRATGTIERSTSFRVEVSNLGDAGKCHRVELLVSSDFDRIREPTLPGDLGVGVWWVQLTDTDNGLPTVDMSSCP